MVDSRGVLGTGRFLTADDLTCFRVDSDQFEICVIAVMAVSYIVIVWREATHFNPLLALEVVAATHLGGLSSGHLRRDSVADFAAECL